MYDRKITHCVRDDVVWTCHQAILANGRRAVNTTRGEKDA